jgi:hypothetical protein
LRSYNGLKKRAHAYCTADKATQTNGLSPLCVFDDQERSNTMLLVVGILPRLTAALASHQEVAECALDRRWRISRALELYTYVCWLFEFHLVPVNECNSERNANFPTRSRNPGLRASWLCACVLVCLRYFFGFMRSVMGTMSYCPPFVLVRIQASGRMHENHGLSVSPGNM